MSDDIMKFLKPLNSDENDFIDEFFKRSKSSEKEKSHEDCLTYGHGLLKVTIEDGILKYERIDPRLIIDSSKDVE